MLLKIILNIYPRSLKSSTSLKRQNLVVPSHGDGDAIQPFKQQLLIGGSDLK